MADTRLAKEIENIVKTEWGGPALFSSFDSQSRGVAIFFKQDLPFKMLDSFNDNQGNVLSVLIELEGKKILVQGVYGPNRDDPNFYSEECFKKLIEWKPNFAVIIIIQGQEQNL